MESLVGGGAESSQMFMTALMSAAVDAVIVIDENGHIIEFSESASSLFGYRRDEVIGKNVSMLMPEPDRSSHDQYIEDFKRTGNQRIIGTGRDVRGRRKAGETFPMHLSVGESTHNGHRLFVGICHDLTDYDQVVTELEAIQQRYQEIFQSPRQYICRLDRDLRITFANDSFTRALGFDGDGLLGCQITVFLEQDDKTQEILNHLISESGEVRELTLVIAMLTKPGERRFVEWSFVTASDPAAVSTGIEVQGVGIDISDKERALRQAQYLQDHDPLTGFLRQKVFVQQCGEWLQKVTRAVFLHIDFERFQVLNQTYGHEFGDAVLAELGSRLRNQLKTRCLFARDRSDAFLVCYEIQAEDHLDEILADLLEVLSNPVDVASQAMKVTTSIGVAFYPDDSSTVEHLPHFAESAMRVARVNGNQIGYFDSNHHQALERELEIEQRLKLALESEQIQLHLQPKFYTDTLVLAGFEALVRWSDPVLGAVSPGEFVPVAEKSSLGFLLDDYVIRTVLSFIAEQNAKGLHVPPIAINITGRHFGQKGFAERLLEELKGHDLEASVIELEITEGVLLEKTETALANLKLLRAVGVRMAIDDFGTGYSSLSYLTTLAIDEIKIDKAFIDNIESEAGSTLVSSVIRIAMAFGISVVAEGVEFESQLQALKQMGCRICQGYLLGKPVAADTAIERWVEQVGDDHSLQPKIRWAMKEKQK